MSELPYVMIMASAGSGKTHRLTTAYVGILRAALRGGEEGERVVERILATTFTRAAAGEIVERVLGRIADAVSCAEERAKLGRDLGGDELGEEECGKLLEAVVRHLHRLQICTLDAFLVGAAVAFAPELGLPAGWRIGDASEAEGLKRDAIERVLEAHVKDKGRREEMLARLVKLHEGSYPREIGPTLAEEFDDTYETYLSAEAGAWEVIGPKTEPLAGKAAARLIGELEKGLPALVPTTKKGEPNSTWAKMARGLLEAARDGDWKGLLEWKPILALAAGEDWETVTYGRAPMPEAFAEAVRPLAEHAVAMVLTELRERNRSARELVAQFDGAYESLKQRRGLFGFDDFPRMLLRGEVVEKLEAFFFRLDARIEHILLDEFQDTSISQWRLLEPLVEEVVSGAGAREERSLLCVGDVKQTLYAWRNAEPRLFAELKEKWPHLRSESLVKSFRSEPEVIEAVNAVFGGLVANPVLQATEAEDAFRVAAAKVWSGWFEKHTTVKEETGWVRLRTCGDGESVADKERSALIMAANRVKELLDGGIGGGAGDIAVLFRRKKHIAAMIELLRKREIHAAGEGGSALTDDAAVCAAMSALHLIDHPGDTAAVYHVGSSPLGKVVGIADGMRPADVAAVTRRWRERLLDAGYAAVLGEWLRGIAGACDRRNLRRFEQLIEAAQAYEGRGGGAGANDVGAFVRAMKDVRVEEGAAARVRVMTIHASKGRQFEVVVLPELDGKFASKGSGLLKHRPGVLEDFDCVTRSLGKNLVGLDEQLAGMYGAWREQDVIEELCGLYVAMTRAKVGLEMIVHPQKANKNGEATLPLSMAGVLRGALTDAVVVEGDSVLWERGREGRIQNAEWRMQNVETGEIEVRVGAATGKRRGMVSPSSLEGGRKVTLAGVLTVGGESGRERGTVVHRWFELVEWLDDGLPAKETLRTAVADLELEEQELGRMMEEFAAFLGQAEVKKLLTRPKLGADETVEVWRERRFAAPLEQGGRMMTVSGAMDRVVVKRKGGAVVGVEVVDYKTDGIGAGGVAEKVAVYRPQIAAYKKALEKMLGVTGASGKLVFLRAGAVVGV